MADLSGSILDGKYELSRLIGEGGMGTVYEATHNLIGRRLAVKFLHSQYVTSPEVITRFQREAQAAAAIGHENIIEVTDMGTGPDNAPYIVMEYLEGVDLKGLLSQEGVLTPVRAAHILLQALSALQAAHKAGIIHRDLKPENIFLIEKIDRPDYVKLLDFGISKFKSLEAEGAKGLTQTGTVLGTPYYMSPEQARGDQNLTPGSDIYAMGVILYQMMTGHLPFDAPNYNALLIKILTEDPVPPEEINPDIPSELVDTIKKSMARDPADRFQDCQEFKQRLLPFAPGSSSDNLVAAGLSPASRTAVQAALSTSTETPLEMSRTGTVVKKSKAPIFIGGAVAMVLLAAGILYFGGFLGQKETEPTTTAVVPVAMPEKEDTAAEKTEDTGEEAEPEEVNLQISASPKEAIIKIDNENVGENPFEGAFSKDDNLHDVVVIADGYETETAQIKFDKDQIITYNLVQLPQEKPRKGSGRKPRKGSEKPSGEASSESSGANKPGKKPKRKIDDEDPWE